MKYKSKKIFFSFMLVSLLTSINSLQTYAEHTHNNNCYSENVHFHDGDEIKG